MGSSRSLACFRYLQEFCKETTLHGLVHLVAPKRHWLEKFVWILALIVSVIGSCWIVAESWHRYVTNPVVISMVKEHRDWNVTLPTGTMCYNDRVDVAKARQLINQHWNVTTTDEKFEYYMDFVKTVANSRLDNLATFEKFANDESLTKINLIEMAVDAAYSQATAAKINLHTHPVGQIITEMGVCISIIAPNSVANKVFSKLVPGRENPVMTEMPYCTSASFACVGTLQIQRSYSVYIHSPLEIPDITTKPSRGLYGNKFLLAVEEEQFYSSPDIRKLWPKQRGCYYPDENIYGDIDVYSMNFCRMQCRRNVIYATCGCVPHFYVKQNRQKYCDAKGLVCVAQHIGQIINDTRVGKSKACNCFPTCEELIYHPNQPYTSRYMGTVFSWNINSYTKSRYRRDIIFEFSDLLVSFGGTAALFLGCSLLTGVEFFYFFTVRLTRFIGKKTVHLRKTIQNQLWHRVNRGLYTNNTDTNKRF